MHHSVSRPLYNRGSGTAVRGSTTLDFVYGYVDSGHWGWSALPNLTTTP